VLSSKFRAQNSPDEFGLHGVLGNSSRGGYKLMWVNDPWHTKIVFAQLSSLRGKITPLSAHSYGGHEMGIWTFREKRNWTK
jgi:hypothetical protein